MSFGDTQLSYLTVLDLSCVAHIDMISEMFARTGLLACAGGNVCNEYEGIPRNMTAIGSKLKAAGYSTHQFGKVTTRDPPSTCRSSAHSFPWVSDASSAWACAVGRRRGQP